MNCQQKINLLDFNFTNPSTPNIQHYLLPLTYFNSIILMYVQNKYGCIDIAHLLYLSMLYVVRCEIFNRTIVT